MEKNKNILIGGLLAIVLVMAVGYAAFATQLTINGTATITSKWDIHFDTTKIWDHTDNSKQVNGVVTPVTGLNNATAPIADVSYTDNQHAVLSATFNQPGDKITFVLTIQNAGTLDATYGTGVSVSAGTSTTFNENQSGAGTYTTEEGNIKFTVANPATNPLTKQTGANPTTTTITVVAEFIDTDTTHNTTGNLTAQETAQIVIGLNYTQYTGN